MHALGRWMDGSVKVKHEAQDRLEYTYSVASAAPTTQATRARAAALDAAVVLRYMSIPMNHSISHASK